MWVIKHNISSERETLIFIYRMGKRYLRRSLLFLLYLAVISALSIIRCSVGLFRYSAQFILLSVMSTTDSCIISYIVICIIPGTMPIILRGYNTSSFSLKVYSWGLYKKVRYKYQYKEFLKFYNFSPFNHYA